MMRQRLFDIIERDDQKDNSLSNLYDKFMVVCIILSLIPLGFRENYINSHPILEYMEWGTTIIFVIDYIFRFITEDLRNKRSSALEAFIRYPFTIYAIIDILSIIPTLLEAYININPAFKLTRSLRLLKLLRAFKIIRYSRSIRLTMRAWYNSKDTLGTVALLSCSYIVGCALIMFNIESEKLFPTFFDALYWATISLTTVGYGDVYSKSQPGQILTMVSSLVGVAIIALPSGIITAGYMKALEEEKASKNEVKE